jgi:hypothetical protein
LRLLYDLSISILQPGDKSWHIERSLKIFREKYFSREWKNYFRKQKKLIDLFVIVTLTQIGFLTKVELYRGGKGKILRRYDFLLSRFMVT